MIRETPKLSLTRRLGLLLLLTSLFSAGWALGQDQEGSPAETRPPEPTGLAPVRDILSTDDDGIGADPPEADAQQSPARIEGELDPGEVPPFDQGHLETLIQQGQWQEVEQLVRVYHHAPTALRIGWYYYEGGDYLLAEQWFNQALTWLDEYPGEDQNAEEVYPNALYGKGLALFQSERYEAAEEFSREFREASPKLESLLADTLLIQAGAAMRQGRYREALEQIEEARPLRDAGFTADELILEGWAHYNIGWENLQQFRQTGDAYYRDVAMEFLDKAAQSFLNSFPIIAQIPDEVTREKTRNSALEGLARAEYARGNYREAYRIVSSPNFTAENAEAIRREIRTGVLAEIYQDLTPQQKVQYLEALRQRNPLTVEQKLDHAMQYMQLRQYETALAIFQHVLEQNPPPAIAAQAYMGLAFSANETGQPVMARAAAERALELRYNLEGETQGALEEMLVNIDAGMAVTAYDNGDFALALQLVERVRKVRVPNLGERAIEAWSHLHLERPRQAFPEFVSLYSDVRQVEPMMTEEQAFLPDYLRNRNPQPTAPLPRTGGSWPYSQDQPFQHQQQQQTLPPYLYERQQPYATPRNALPDYLQPSTRRQPAAPVQDYTSPPAAAPPLGQTQPRRPSRPQMLMRNLFDTGDAQETVEPPSLFDVPDEGVFYAQNTPPNSRSRQPEPDFLPDDADLFGQGDSTDPESLPPEFAREVLQDEFGENVLETPGAPQQPGTTAPVLPRGYGSPAPEQARQRQISDAELNQLLNELAGRQDAPAKAQSPRAGYEPPATPAQTRRPAAVGTPAMQDFFPSSTAPDPTGAGEERYYQGQYIPRLEDLAKGLFLSGVRSGQIEEVKRLARQWGGPLAAETADRLRKRKLYMQVLEMRPDAEPALENYDTARFNVSTFLRTKSGDTGQGQLDTFHFPVATYEQESIFGDDSDRMAFSAAWMSLDAGDLDADAAFGRFPANPAETGRGAPETSYDNLFELKLRWWEEDWTSRFVELGLTPVNGPISATMTGRIGVRQQIDRGYWRAEIYRESRKESILSYVGAKDPYTGEFWGQVVENAISIEGLLGLGSRQPERGGNLLNEDDLSVFGKLTIGFLSGEGVADNTHYGATVALQKQFESEMFDYLLGGIAFSAESYEENLSFFTRGHGGYFSPEYLLQTHLFLQFLTQEGYHHLIGGNAMLGYQTNRQERAPFFPLNSDGRFYQSERSSTPIGAATVEGAFLLSPNWKAGITLHAAATADYDEFYAGLTLTYFFEPRKGLYSTDLALPFDYP